MAGCLDGCFSFLGMSQKGLAPFSSSSSSSKPAGTTSSIPPIEGLGPAVRHRKQGKVSGKSRIRPDAEANLSKDLGLSPSDLKPGMGDFTLDSLEATFDETLFVKLMEKLIKEAKYLQNNPRAGVVPEEERAAKIVMDCLNPFSTKNGGPLQIELLEYVPKRPNLKVTYAASTNSRRTIGFVGSHMDVVPANPEEWARDPFKLVRDGDKLYGRGTTDCLGHVALLAVFLRFLALTKPKLDMSVVCVFIAAEEGGEFGVGVDRVLEDGKLEELKNGPVFWIDAADSQPCAGTCGVTQWELKTTGRLFHSGLPHKGINSIELAMDTVAELQRNFYSDFGPVSEQKSYGFGVGSTMKPTQICCSEGSLNQIPPWCKVSGDIRLVPFYDMLDVIDRVEKYVENINANLSKLNCETTRGAYSKYDIKEAAPEAEITEGRVEISWGQSKESALLYAGIAADLTSTGHKALVQATAEAKGAENCKPYSITGSLPLVGMMQRQGFDIQLDGFGLMSVYHAVNEYCDINHMRKGHEIMLRILCLLNTAATEKK
ncbi:unnamed protein product [Amoebophrya sp. A25]|nr:unnamed protein product [Amoebophrya sp. A25]|eukprot:GSA25T00009741001.1